MFLFGRHDKGSTVKSVKKKYPAAYEAVVKVIRETVTSFPDSSIGGIEFGNTEAEALKTTTLSDETARNIQRALLEHFKTPTSVASQYGTTREIFVLSSVADAIKIDQPYPQSPNKIITIQLKAIDDCMQYQSRPTAIYRSCNH